MEVFSDWGVGLTATQHLQKSQQHFKSWIVFAESYFKFKHLTTLWGKNVVRHHNNRYDALRVDLKRGVFV